MKRKILLALTFILVLFTCVSCSKPQNIIDTDKGVNDNNPQQLQILKSDLKLTQEQVLSKIKAEHIKENGGYLNSDEIVVLIKLSENALIDTYNKKANTNVKSIAEYINTESGIKQANDIAVEQQKLIRKLYAEELITNVEYQYSTIINAVAVKTTYGNLEKIGNFKGVKATIMSETYNLPKTTSTDASVIENLVDVYETGIFNSSSVSYTGIGTAVAVLDSGFDCSHTVFANQPENPMISMEDISKVLHQTRAAGFTKDIEIKDVYYSRKIPFVYDYADKDVDVFPYDSEHGTHVAGIIGGKDDVITGIAVNTQLVLLKVFPDLNEGARTEDIVAALEDAVILGVDAINMSLGTSCGFAREADADYVNEVYDKINESGISLITAASNDYSSSHGGAQGDTNFVTNPDSGTVGSPSTYATSLSVASISGVKSKYLVGNDSQVIFFTESNDITGEPNDFFEGLGITKGVTKEYEYVTIPGVGLKVNYIGLDVKGKIALVRRGDNTFEEKALNAKAAGAIACIIYNNIDGNISMSMGKTDHIPTVSISKDDGTILAQKDEGKITISFNNQAGPFMSDFSSWGPTPSLGLKPEITAHGGNIKSAIPGGSYDELSGTSMASPNLCGIVVLIRQYLKEKYPDYSWKEISVLANQLLMSTATIVLNEQGNPYSPRKQGAGLASLINSVNTKCYLSVDGIDRTKLELLDDPERTGVYTMEFNLVNLSNENMEYNLSVIGMTESVSTSDKKHVAEKSQIIQGVPVYEVYNGKLEGEKITVLPNQTAKIKVVYTLSDDAKNIIDTLFPYGMYVEGFVKLEAVKDEEVDLNIPFLAFYGDWTEAPIFDKTYYEVESEAHNAAIDDEDKLKADYYATIPYGSYYYNYIIPLGTYLYDIDKTMYDEIPASTDHIAISDYLGTIDGISAIYAGMLRNSKTVDFSITDKITGEVIWEHTDYNGLKAHGRGGSPMPYFDFLKLKSYQLGLVNNRQYSFVMKAKLDYGDGGEKNNIRNTFEFDFVLDNEAPVLKNATYEKIYDTTLKKDRYYITLTIYDNQYVQAIYPVIFTASNTYTYLSDNPIPVYSEKGKDNKVRFEITDYLEDIYTDSLITNAIAFSIDDYALNSNIYLCQLPGTRGDFKFTEDGSLDSNEMMSLTVYQDEIVDLTRYLTSTDTTLDDDKAYLNHLIWLSSNDKIASVKEGILVAHEEGRTVITVQEPMNMKKKSLIIKVKAREQEEKNRKNASGLIGDSKVDSIRISHFKTLFAYSRAAQTSEIGKTGSTTYLSSLSSLSFYPGEKIQLFYDINPWYVDDKYEKTFESTNPSVATVDENGVVTGLKEGSTTITLKLKGSNIMARVRITIKSEFVIENRMLVAYKGLGGDVVIPDDEGILYIGAYAFCLYDTDQEIELTDDDYDANKIPNANTTVKSVVIPHGVMEIQKYAFYNCSGLETVVIPETVKTIREYAFQKDVKLKNINLDKIQVIGHEAFSGCKTLANITLNSIYAIGASAFEGCTSLTYANLTTLRNTGMRAFKDCTSLENVALSENTKFAKEMFVNSGLKEIEIITNNPIPTFCFAQCHSLEKVTIKGTIPEICYGAFCESENLTTVIIEGTVEIIGEQAFYACTALKDFTLPNNNLTLSNYCFRDCTNLETIYFQENTNLEQINGSIFEGTKVSKFNVDDNNQYYSTTTNLLLSKDGKTIIFAAPSASFGDYIVDSKIETIGDGAFAGADINSITFTKPITIGNYAFANCKNLTLITLPTKEGTVIKDHTFNSTVNLYKIDNLDKVKEVGAYAFANSGLGTAVLSSNATFGEGAFFKSKLAEVTVGENTTFGVGAFQNCVYLTTVNMPAKGNVLFGEGCFSNDILLDKIDLSKVGAVIENETFYGCTRLKAADLVNVETIGDYAFADCSSLNYLNMPIVKSIGEGAFCRYDEKSAAPQITSVVLPETLTTMGDGAFIGCEGLTEIKLPSSLTKVGDFTFALCLKLEKVELPEEIKSVGDYAFMGCEVLSNINLKNVETMGDYAFRGCFSLETIDLASVKSIGEGVFTSCQNLNSIGDTLELQYVGILAFQGANLTEVNAPKLNYISELAFENNKSLNKFVLSTDLEFIGTAAFAGCDAIESFYVKQNNELIDTADINSYAKLINGVLYTYLENGNLLLSSVPGNYKQTTLIVEEGTVRIDTYAGNENKNIQTIVLPDTLKIIGNYAFYGYENLQTVEFKSFTAPALEDEYNKDVKLEENDPGYDLLHNQFDMFKFELYYFTFIDLVGKKEPIKMVLPMNQDVEGYDSIVYEAYFGKVADAARSDYEAMHSSMINFVEYATKISNITIINLTHEKLVNDALYSLNLVKQDPTKYGISMEKWNSLTETVNEAKQTIRKLKLASSEKSLQDLDIKIKNLPSKFDISQLQELQEISKQLSALKRADRSLLDLTNYNQLVESYNEYITNINAEVEPIVNTVNRSFIYIGIALLTSLACITYITSKRHSL